MSLRRYTWAIYGAEKTGFPTHRHSEAMLHHHHHHTTSCLTATTVSPTLYSLSFCNAIMRLMHEAAKSDTEASTMARLPGPTAVRSELATAHCSRALQLSAPRPFVFLTRRPQSDAMAGRRQRKRAACLDVFLPFLRFSNRQLQQAAWRVLLVSVGVVYLVLSVEMLDPRSLYFSSSNPMPAGSLIFATHLPHGAPSVEAAKGLLAGHHTNEIASVLILSHW